MPIPKTRIELTDLVTTNFMKLRGELDRGGPSLGRVACVDDWSVKDVLAVRAWWTANVIDWIETGRRGETPVTPAEGYAWSDTPRLNADIVEAARDESYSSIRARLERGFKRVLATIDALDDDELLGVGVYEWAGKWPVSRWISINTQRQYETAHTFIRRAMREQSREQE